MQIAAAGAGFEASETGSHAAEAEADSEPAILDFQAPKVGSEHVSVFGGQSVERFQAPAFQDR